MELLGVSETDEECVILCLEEQLGEHIGKDILYLADKRAVVVFSVDDRMVDALLNGSRSYRIDEKSYRARRLYNAELLGVSDAELTVLYLHNHIGTVVHDRHFPDEQRLVVAFDAAEAIEKLSTKERHAINEEVAFRVKSLSKSQQERLHLPSLQQLQQDRGLTKQQQEYQQQHQERLLEQPNAQQGSQQHHRFMQQKRQQQQQPQQDPQQTQQHLEPQPEQQQQQHQPHGQAESTTHQVEHSVIVKGIPENMSRPALELELTKQWKQMGISYRHVDYNPCSGVAVVSFSCADDAHNVLQHGKSKATRWSIMVCDSNQSVCDLLGDVVLLIDHVSPEFSSEALWCWLKLVVGEFAHTIVYSSIYARAVAIFTYFKDLNLDDATKHTKKYIVDDQRLHVSAIRQTKNAQALELPEQATSSVLLKHLEDYVYGGRQGSVACLKMTDERAAVITFSEEYELSKAIGRKQMLLGKEILLVPLFDDLGPVKSARQVFKFGDMKKALLDGDVMTKLPVELTVTGFDSREIDEHILRQFLTQRQKSGGGEIESFVYFRDKAVVTFADSASATRVYQKCQQERLQLCGCRLLASLRTFDVSDASRKDQVLLRNIGTASDDSLKYWLWGLSDNQVHQIDFIRKQGDPQLCAIAHFDRDVDFHRLARALKAATLDGLLIELDFVSLPKSLLATNVPIGIHAEAVELSFSNFGGVQEVRELVPRQWVITFCKSADASSACREKIILRDVELITKPYNDYRVQLDTRKKGKRGRLTLPLDFVHTAVLAFARSKRKTELDDFLQRFRSIVSTDEKSGVPAVVCSLSSSDPHYRDAVQRWQTLQEACITFFSPFHCKSIPVSTSVYEAVVTSDRFLSIAKQFQQDVLVTHSFNKDQPVQEIVIAGSSLSMDDALCAMQLIVRDVSDAVERCKQHVKQVTDHLAESKLKLLDAIGFCKTVQARYADLDVDIDWQSRVVRFEGLPSAIAESTEEMKRILSGSSEDTIQGSSAMLTLVGREEIRNFIDEQLKLKNLTDKVVWYLRPSFGISVHGRDSQSAHDAAAIIRTVIIDRQINLDVDSAKLISSEKWEGFTRDIIVKYHENLVLNNVHSKSDQSGLVLYLSCKATDSVRVVEEVQEFLRRHSQKEDFVPLPSIMVEYITRFMQDSMVAQIEKKQSHNFVRLNPVRQSTPDVTKTGFQILGNQDGIINAKRTLSHLTKLHKVSVKKHELSFPGAEKHLRSNESVLMRIGNETKTIICLSSGAEEEMGLQLDESGLLTAVELRLPCGTELQILRGDITQLSCDVIVNPANSELLHKGGLAAVIGELGGKTMLDECTAFVKDHGQLVDGQVCITAAGNLRCKKVIHAVGPQWQGGTRNEENKLFSAVQNSLTVAVQQGLSSIAMPPISSGVFSYPIEKCTKTIVESVIDFCKCATKRPQKIILVDNKSDGVKNFKNAVDQLMRITEKTPALALASVSSRRLQKVDNHAGKEIQLLPASVPPNASQVTLPCGTALHVLRGDIVQLNCDVIVNPTDGLLQLKGGVGAVIADKGGQVIIDECTTFLKDHGQLSDGDVCVTGAGALPFKKVIHTVGPRWHGGSRNEENKLFSAVQNSLTAAMQHNFDSIAVPPISSGFFGYPIEKSTKTIVESIADFCKNEKKTPKKIYLLDNKDEGAKCFSKAIDQLISSINSTAGQTVTGGSVTMSSNVRETASVPQGNADEPVQATPKNILQPLTIGTAVVELIEGSLLDQKVDVIVNTVGPKLVLDQGALSKCVGDAAGPALQLSLSTDYQNGLSAGEVAFTKGFQLSCQHIFHCCCSYWNTGNADQVLADLLSKCLTKAAQLGVSSIAIPAIGTGELGFPPKECSRITYEAVFQYCRSKPNSSVRYIKIIVKNPPSIVSAFQAQHLSAIRGDSVYASAKPVQSSFPARGRGTECTDSPSPPTSRALSFTVAVSICGQEGGIETAIKALEEYCRKTIMEHTVRGQEEICKTLSRSQEDVLVQQGVEDGVEVKVYRNSGTVIIRSLDRSALSALQLQVGHILTSQHVELLKHEQAASRCQWQFLIANEQWQDYEPSLNAKLERAFQASEKFVSYKSKDEKQYTVDLTLKKDFIKGHTASGADVRRIDKGLGLLGDLTSAEKYFEELVTPGSQEYDKVKDAFFKTAAPSSQLKIVEIKRVRNIPLLKQYEIQAVVVKGNMQQSTKLPVERWLWHGTDDVSVLNICQKGFNRSYCGVNGVYHGQGVYFARDSSYSAQGRYSKPNDAGLKHMIYCRVLTGEFVQGDPKMRTPPPKPYGDKANYDSTVDNVNDPAAFVVYNDNQAYPEYVVKFR